MGWETRRRWWRVHLAHLGAKYAEGSQGPETTAETAVVFPGTTVTPQLEELSMREGGPKEKLFTEVLSSGWEHPILLYSIAFLHLPKDVIARGIKSLFFQLGMGLVSSYLWKHMWGMTVIQRLGLLQWVDVVCAYPLVCIWLMCICFCLLHNFTESIWIMNEISFYLFLFLP